MDLVREDDRVLPADIGGTLRTAELDLGQHQPARESAGSRPVRLLGVLEELGGLEGGMPTIIGAISRSMPHLATPIERMAIVGADRWRSEALMCTGADLRRPPVASLPVAPAGPTLPAHG